MNKKFLFTLAALVFMPFATMFAKSLVFTLDDGTLVYYRMDGEVAPKMKFVDGKVVVNTDTYEFSGIRNFYVSETDDPNGIDDVQASRPQTSFNGTALYVDKSDAKIAVYTVDGKKVDVEIGRTDGFTVVETVGLEKGVYVVKVGKTSFKFVKK